VVTQVEAGILGLLLGYRKTGYELVQDFRGSIFYWSGSQSTVYTALQRLEDDGLIAGYSRGARSTEYTITEDGKQALTEFALEPLSGEKLLSQPDLYRMKLRTASALDAKQRLDCYRAQRAQVVRAIGLIQLNMPSDSKAFSGRLGLLCIRQLQEDISFLDTVIAEAESEIASE